MAGPIGIAIARAIAAVRCPHCGKQQARAREPEGRVRVCHHCKRQFDVVKPTDPRSGKRKRR